MRTVVVYRTQDEDKRVEIGRAIVDKGGRAVIEGFMSWPDEKEDWKAKGIYDPGRTGERGFIPLSEGNRFLDVMMARYADCSYTDAEEQG